MSAAPAAVVHLLFIPSLNLLDLPVCFMAPAEAELLLSRVLLNQFSLQPDAVSHGSAKGPVPLTDWGAKSRGLSLTALRTDH